MRCTLQSAFVFAYLCFAYGLAAAAISKGLKYFTPTVIISIRFFSGFFICLVVLLIRIFTDSVFRRDLKQHLFPSFSGVMHMCGTGLVYQGFPHILMAIAQNGMVTSTSAQVMQPFATTIAAIASHFILPDEKFDKQKFYSMLAAIIGVGMTVVPSFGHTTSSISPLQMAMGYLILLGSVSCFGIGAIYMKLKTSSFEVAVTSTFQMLASALFASTAAYFTHGKIVIMKQLTTTPIFSGWIWPIVVGFFASGLGMHGTLYLIEKIGAVGVNFTTFGQIMVGVIAGVVWMKDWAGYRQWEIFISIGGILFLGIGILIGFAKPPQAEYKPIFIESLPEI